MHSGPLFAGEFTYFDTGRMVMSEESSGTSNSCRRLTSSTDGLIQSCHVLRGRITGIRSWISRMRVLAEVVIIAQETR